MLSTRHIVESHDLVYRDCDESARTDLMIPKKLLEFQRVLIHRGSSCLLLVCARIGDWLGV